jgi:hypothetical protein
MHVRPRGATDGGIQSELWRLIMRKWFARVAAAGTVVLLIPAALVSAHARHRQDHFRIVRHLAPYSRLVGSHFAGTSAAHVKPARAAAVPPGSSSVPGYCEGPVVDTLYSFTAAPGPASGSVSTSVNNELVAAFVGSAGPKTGGQSVTVSGGGLTWHKVGSENAAGGDSEVWYAIAPNRISRQKITATQSKKPFAESLTVVTFKAASGVGASGSFTSSKGAPTGTITTTKPCGWVWAAGNDPAAGALRKVPSGQNAWVQALILGNVYGAPSTFWTQSTNLPTTTAGTPVTINDTAPANDPYNLVLAEIF